MIEVSSPPSKENEELSLISEEKVLRRRISDINHCQTQDKDTDESQSDSDDDDSASQDSYKAIGLTPSHDTVTLESTTLTIKDVCRTTTAQNRKNKTIGKLGLDHFDPTCIEEKEAKLRTETPMKWYQGLKAYFETSSAKNRVEMKKQKNQKVSILRIRFVSPQNKEVHLSLNFVTGVLHVKCTMMRKWIGTEFSKIDINSINSKREDQQKEKEKRKEKEKETEKEKEKQEEKAKAKGDDGVKVNEKEIENIWAEIVFQDGSLYT